MLTDAERLRDLLAEYRKADDSGDSDRAAQVHGQMRDLSDAIKRKARR